MEKKTKKDNKKTVTKRKKDYESFSYIEDSDNIKL